MRHVCRSTLAALAAALVLGAVGASSALAAPEWYVKTGGSFGKVTSAHSIAASHVNLTVEDSAGAPVALKCTEGKVEGTIEAGGVGKITTYNMSDCQATLGSCSTPSAEAVNLPWKTELYSEGTRVRARLVSGGSGTPGWHFTCGGVGHATCNFNTSANMVNTVGGAEAIFNKESNKTACTGGAEAGRLEGSLTFASSEKGVEAIKIEPLESPEWRLGGKPLTESVATTVSGHVLVTDEPEGVKLNAVECEYTGTGSVGPGAVGEETSIVFSGCAVKAGKCPKPGLEVGRLSWHTELAVFEGVLQEDLNGSGARPLYVITCTGIVKDQCYGPFHSSSMANVGTEGGVESPYRDNGLECTAGGKATGSVEGSQITRATKGKLEVTQ